MKLRDCIFLLPSYELDGYPRSLPSESAEDLLSGWLAMWHPRLLASTPAPPRWQQASQLPSELERLIFVLPSIAESELEVEAEPRIATAGSVFIRPTRPWRACQDSLLEAATTAGLIDSPESPSELVEELRVEFAALGYAYLQIQLMTRQLRYTSNLDMLLFGKQVGDAAEATLAGDRETAEQMLQASFDSLGQERDHYYSLDVSLIDITLLAPTTLGQSLKQQLSQLGNGADTPTTFLASGEILRSLSEKNPETHQQLCARLADGQAAIAGGLDVERPHPLMVRESIARDLMRGRAAYRSLNIDPPRVFARASFGMTPDIVSLLRRWGFEGCLLNAWSGGSYPQGNQAKISWEASDGTFLSAIAAPVLDSSDPASFLALGWTIGEALDHQHVPTIVFAHWPNRSCDFLELLQVIARHTPALGKWRLADEYFKETDQPYHQERLTAAGFRYNWLLESSAAGRFLQSVKEFHSLQARCRSLQNLGNLAWQLEHYHEVGKRTNLPSNQIASAAAESATGEKSADHDLVRQQPAANSDPQVHAMESSEWFADFASLCDRADGLLDNPPQALERARAAREISKQIAAQLLERLAKQLHKPSRRKSSNTGSAAPSGQARILLNPRSCPLRRMTHTAKDVHLEETAAWNFAEGRVGEERVTAVDIPSQGFVIAPMHVGAPASNPKQRPLADAGGLLNNEFLEAQIDTARGHLRSLHIPAKRGNRLSLMLARRDRLESKASTPQYAYSEMVVGEVRMLTSSNICGLIRATGHFELDDKKVGNFEIDYQLYRGSRILEIQITLSQLADLSDDNPWRSAYIARIAWPMEAALLRSFSNGHREQWASGRTISPQLIEIDETAYRTHYLTGGLAFHRRMEERFLETILACRGDQSVTHRIGVAVDLPHPLLAATQFLDRGYEIDVACEPGTPAGSGWLATVDTKNVTVDLECPLVDEAGQLAGVRLFLVETDGKSTNAHVRLMREVRSAARVDYLGGRIGKITADGDRLTIAMRAGEQVNVDVIWA